MRIKTIKDFYNFIFETRDFKRKLLRKKLNAEKIKKSEIKKLEKYVVKLLKIPLGAGNHVLEYAEGKKTNLDLFYEIDELIKDVIFLSETEKNFMDYLNKMNEDFENDVETGLEFISKSDITTFISDRDGTINNYCGRYNSSIQSIYNASYLIDIAKILEKPVILTSAPLQNTGFLDMNIMPPNFFVIAGSKGREFTWKNQFYKMHLDEQQQQKLNILNQKLQDLINKPYYEVFALIGSGLQFKFGETTIARQDVYNSIPQQDSQNFLQKVEEIVRNIDPKQEYFSIIDTGKDIEIILHKKDAGVSSEFSKGDGIEFISKKIGLNLTEADNLICGDTASDLAMLEYAEKVTPNNYSIFVTQDEKLKEKVGKFASKNLFVSSPDALVTILHKYALERSTN
ncbi:MAG TPA: trehalose 6-phosphate synthase [Candidatus Cloacimonas sp.]|nr:trehalose 6-phosphate synthase [Candidatus Cloacimonas sp.]